MKTIYQVIANNRGTRNKWGYSDGGMDLFWYGAPAEAPDDIKKEVEEIRSDINKRSTFLHPIKLKLSRKRKPDAEAMKMRKLVDEDEVKTIEQYRKLSDLYDKLQHRD